MAIRNHLLGVALMVVIITVMVILSAVVEALAVGSTSQRAISRCGETHLLVSNNISEPLHVAMWGQYELLEPGESVWFWTDEPVTVDRVTRRRSDQVYHTSITSTFETTELECTIEWATL